MVQLREPLLHHLQLPGGGLCAALLDHQEFLAVGSHIVFGPATDRADTKLSLKEQARLAGNKRRARGKIEFARGYDYKALRKGK